MNDEEPGHNRHHPQAGKPPEPPARDDITDPDWPGDELIGRLFGPARKRRTSEPD